MKKFSYILLIPTLLYGCGTNIENTQLPNNNLDNVTQETTSESFIESTNATIDVTQYSFNEENTSIETQLTSIDDTVSTQTTTNITTTDVTSISTITTTTPPAMGFNDSELLVLAQSLYDVACEMAWNYYSSTPYNLDYDNFITDDYNNKYYLVADEEITSLDDVKNDWLTVFSTKYYDANFGNRFLESNDRVYVNGAEGIADMYYNFTEITEITSKSDDGTEVFFKAVSHYVDFNDNSPMDDKIDEFSIILEDGSYHVGEFTLPY